MAMQRFLWRGIDGSGRGCRGMTTASDVARLRQRLREREIALDTASALPDWLEALLTPRLTGTDGRALADFLNELATLSQAGVPLVNALEMATGETRRGPLQRAIGPIRAEVAAGTPLSRALAGHPRLFDPLTCAMVRAGEQASAVATLLERAARHHERAAMMRQQLQRALTYPLIILLVAIAVSTALIALVVPRFESMLIGLGTELPALTRELIDLADWLRGGGWLLIPVMLGTALTGLALATRVDRLRRGRDRCLLRLPLVGPLLQRLLTARFARTLGIMIEAGVPLAEALPAIGRAMGNLAYEEAIEAVGAALQDGQRLETALRRTGRFPPVMCRMVAVGEESGQLEAMLLRIAEREEAGADQAARALGTAMEPLVMILLGLLIGGLVLALYLPVFRLGEAL